MEGYRRCIVVVLISAIPVDDAGFFCEEVSLNIIALSTFAIGDRIEYGIGLCRLILDLERHIPW